MMSSFNIQEIIGEVPDGLGGLIDRWGAFKTVEGYIDMLTGTDLNTIQNAITEESTHILIIPHFTEGITDDMRVVDKDDRYYSITY